MAAHSLDSLVKDRNEILWSSFNWSPNLTNYNATANAWGVIPLNTVVSNNIDSCSLSSNQISLPSGTYIAVASKILQRTSHSRIGIYNVTDSTIDIQGINTYCYPSDSFGYKNVFCQGILKPTEVTVYELRYIVTSAGLSGLGSYKWGSSVIATISIGKLIE